jgi:hypothetical protein
MVLEIKIKKGLKTHLWGEKLSCCFCIKEMFGNVIAVAV